MKSSILVTWTNIFFLQPQQPNLQETNKQTSVKEETARVFLDEILSEVCGDDDKPQREQLGKEEGRVTFFKEHLKNVWVL